MSNNLERKNLQKKESTKINSRKCYSIIRLHVRMLSLIFTLSLHLRNRSVKHILSNYVYWFSLLIIIKLYRFLSLHCYIRISSCLFDWETTSLLLIQLCMLIWFWFCFFPHSKFHRLCYEEDRVKNLLTPLLQLIPSIERRVLQKQIKFVRTRKGQKNISGKETNLKSFDAIRGNSMRRTRIRGPFPSDKNGC